MILKNEVQIADVMFISDLHLHPDRLDITEKFVEFSKWVINRTKKLYILGDFIHAWPGDDAMDAWSNKITNILSTIVSSGIDVYFMPGNRDFLIGKEFLRAAKMQVISDPAIIKIDDIRVLLVHGDCFCTADKGHQLLMKLTRNNLFKQMFLCLPYSFRAKIVYKVRKYSQTSKAKKSINNMQVVVEEVINYLQKYNLHTVIHGHTHTPGLTKHGDFSRYVLSDWDERPLIMCYNKTNKFYYCLFGE